MSLEDKIKKSAEFVGITTISCGMVYGIQEILGLIDNTMDYDNLVYSTISGVGLTITYYLGKQKI
jgi:hypothetical protein